MSSDEPETISSDRSYATEQTLGDARYIYDTTMGIKSKIAEG
jgi:hypothetical protein